MTPSNSFIYAQRLGIHPCEINFIQFKIFINKQAPLYPLMSHMQAKNSRFSILEWINDTLLLPLSKIEELGAGNVYCQLLDAAFPERVPLHKVKWEAKV